MKLHGVHIDKALWEKCKSKTMKAEEIFLIRNIEQRRVVMEYVGVENLLKRKRAKDKK